MEQKSGLLKQGVLLSLMAVFASVLSFGKEAVFANYFGLSPEADAYNIAIVVYSTEGYNFMNFNYFNNRPSAVYKLFFCWLSTAYKKIVE